MAWSFRVKIWFRVRFRFRIRSDGRRPQDDRLADGRPIGGTVARANARFVARLSARIGRPPVWLANGLVRRSSAYTCRLPSFFPHFRSSRA